MQHDEVIWQVINHNHCSYKAKTETLTFCRNEYNVTGLCNRSSCPLANSRYATIREHEGVLYLYMKSVERAHMPSKLWERLKLPRNYGKALELIDKYLEYWPKFLVHKNKQRLTKMTQYLIRMRKLALSNSEKLVTMPRKKEKREARREAKAEIAAALDRAVEKELLQRLHSGTYGDIHNIPTKAYEKVLDMEEIKEEEEDEEEEEPVLEYVEGDYEDEDEDIEDVALADNEDEMELEEDDAEEEEDDSDEEPRRKRKKGGDSRDPKRLRRPKVQIQYEEDEEPLQMETLA